MMIPNKKTLNAKNQSPWILCPSKSFPGRFYYFNGSTGETAWSLSDSDKNIKKDTIAKVTDQTHTYPEPFDPPNGESTNTNSLTPSTSRGSFKFGTKVTKEAPWYHKPLPSFGQAVFPKYGTQAVVTPKVIWAWTPMVVENQPSQPTQMIDQITQTFPQTSSEPLNPFQPINRTSNYPKVVKFSQNSTQTEIEKPMFGQASFSSFKSKEFNMFSTKPQMKDEACQTFEPIRPMRERAQFESSSTSKSALNPGRSVKNLTSLFTRDVEMSTMSPRRKVDNADKLNDLDKNDLRFLLVAKKKKVELGETSKSVEDQTKAHKTQKSMAPGKRVTFDLDEDISSEDTPGIDQSPEYSQENPIRPAPSGGHEWYVIADVDALVTDYQCIEEYVKRDSCCRLMVPCVVRAQLTARARGGGAIAARQTLRKIMTPTGHVLVQTDIEYAHSSPEDNILQCCWDLLQEKCRVVLITNNKTMLTEAKSIDLKCYTLDEIKDGYRSLPVPQIDFKKLKIVVDNEEKQSENLFMQHVNEMKKLGSTKINGFPVHESRMNFINGETNVNNIFCKKDNNYDKLINLTKSNKSNALNSEMSNVKEQTTRLSIAENSNIQTRTMIMKKVLQNTEIDRNARNVDVQVQEKENYKQTNVKNKADYKSWDIGSVASEPDIIDEDIRRLYFAETNAEKNRDTIKVSGITKLNNQFNLDEELETFCVENARIENRIKGRLDEWVCRLCQIMESALMDVLLKEKANVKCVIPLPLHKYRYLYEPIQVIGKTFEKQEGIRIIVDEFSRKLLDLSAVQGDLIKNMKPNEFMKLFGLSKILLQMLKDVVYYEELYEAEDMLDDLLRNVKDPDTDIDLELKSVAKQIFSPSEDLVTREVAFRKSDKQIIEYLKKHFEDWNKADDPPKNNKTNIFPNIVKTSGKKLSELKIDNNKALTVDKESSINKGTDKVTNEPKIIRNIKIIESFDERLKNKHKIELDELNYINKGTNKVTDEPKIISNIKIIESFEERLRNKDKIELDELNYINKETDKVTNESKLIRNFKIIETFEKRLKNKDKIEPDEFNYDGSAYDDEPIKIDVAKSQAEAANNVTDYRSVLEDLSLSVSSVGTECIKAYPLAKIFLIRMKETLVLIFNFINEAIRQHQNGMPTARKDDFRLKVNVTREYLLKLIVRLKNIIARESDDGITLKDLLIQAGDYVEDDQVMANYKEIIAKLLEQAHILEDALSIMLSLFNGSPKERDTGYLTNVSFIALSPILPTRSLRRHKIVQ